MDIKIRWQKVSDRPVNDFDDNQSSTNFWTDGKNIYYRYAKLTTADLENFQYFDIWGFDGERCYLGETRLHSVDAATFRVLNYTYAIDKYNVYTITGKVEEANIKTFEVLDCGQRLLRFRGGNPEYTYWGYARDKNHIYYHNYEGRPKKVKNADLETFISLNDGMFAKDDKSVFAYGKQIKNADVKSWRKILDLVDSNYSMDNNRIFYVNREIKNADYATFEVIPYKEKAFYRKQIARDKNAFYLNDEEIEKGEFDKYIAQLDK